jgi:hypothetical protein
LTPVQLQAIAEVLQRVGAPQVQWIHSYVTDDRSMRTSPDAEAVREHAKRGGFPANRVSQHAKLSIHDIRDRWRLAAATAPRPAVGRAANALQVHLVF